MSQPRFAPITSSLLSRNGDAQPWTEPAKQPLSWERSELPFANGAVFYRSSLPPGPAPARQAVKPMPAAQDMPPHFTAKATPAAMAPLSAHEPAHSHVAVPGDWKKISVRMSHHDYERLGIMAVKQDKTRQRLLHEALDQLLAGITQQYGARCACLREE